MLTVPVISLPQHLRIANLPADTMQKFDWVFIGEAGSPDSDRLFDNILNALNLQPEQVFVAKTVSDDAATASSLLENLASLQAARVVALGPHTAKAILSAASSPFLSEPFGKQRGVVHEVAGQKVIVTYHPAQLLRHPPAKAQAWVDLKFAQAI